MNSERVQDLGSKIIGQLKAIFDPEIPVDIYELGLIYDVMISDENDVKSAFKLNAWMQISNLSIDDAKKMYIRLVNEHITP
ncbi:MAG: FeS assembly SUF system protein [Flavobacteriaceae bacterium]|nr:MAG: FeS assembly SUF system protein [Flavobacteriaceae bacterium]